MKTAIDDIRQHMDNNDDWEMEDLFFRRLDFLHIDEYDFICFLEQYVHPSIERFTWSVEDCTKRIPFDNLICVQAINKYLSNDGYELVQSDQISGFPMYSVQRTSPGVSGTVKNIIFASKYKPEIAFDDALNNDIRITKNADCCLIYDRLISNSGLKWSELVGWYADSAGISGNKENQELAFCHRLIDSMDSEPEKTILRAYYLFIHERNIDGPALIPQVYLYYDPLTMKQRGYKLFDHQRMDFLMIFSHKDRVILEIDGKQHYSESGKPSPHLYAEMVKAHREMSLLGYDVYRFGGFEFTEAQNVVIDKIKSFFCRLFQKYGMI